MKKVIAILIALAIACTGAYFIFFQKSDEEKILECLENFETAYASGDLNGCIECFDAKSRNALNRHPGIADHFAYFCLCCCDHDSGLCFFRSGKWFDQYGWYRSAAGSDSGAIGLVSGKNGWGQFGLVCVPGSGTGCSCLRGMQQYPLAA